jgi:hypothetical protein
LSDVEHLLGAAEPSWPRLDIAARRGSIDGFRERIDEGGATMILLGAAAVVRRSPGSAVFTFEGEPSLEAVVHPYLAPVAGLLSHWHGRESIHAGAFVVDGGAWALIAEREGGKSSTLARLALDGVPIAGDDLLVIERGTVFAGPRALDLRRDAARILGVGEPMGVLGARERWRLVLEPDGGALPLRGWIFLAWGDDVSIRPVPAGERFRRLVAQRTIRLAPRDPSTLLNLAAQPAFELRRPRSWSSLEAATKVLLASLR